MPFELEDKVFSSGFPFQQNFIFLKKLLKLSPAISHRHGRGYHPVNMSDVRILSFSGNDFPFLFRLRPDLFRISILTFGDLSSMIFIDLPVKRKPDIPVPLFTDVKLVTIDSADTVDENMDVTVFPWLIVRNQKNLEAVQIGIPVYPVTSVGHRLLRGYFPRAERFDKVIELTPGIFAIEALSNPDFIVESLGPAVDSFCNNCFAFPQNIVRALFKRSRAVYTFYDGHTSSSSYSRAQGSVSCAI